jgi:hypothetical protein
MILLLKVAGKRKNGDLVLSRKGAQSITEAVEPSHVAQHHAKELLEQFEVAIVDKPTGFVGFKKVAK